MKIIFSRNKNLEPHQFLFEHPKIFKAIYDVVHNKEPDRQCDIEITKDFYGCPKETIEYKIFGPEGGSVWENYNEHEFFNNLFATGKDQIDYITYGYVCGKLGPWNNNLQENEYYTLWVNVYLKKS
jgi:hypothetical protein